jgi:hypothetical protein
MAGKIQEDNNQMSELGPCSCRRFVNVTKSEVFLLPEGLLFQSLE